MKIKKNILLILFCISIGTWPGITQEYTKDLDNYVDELSDNTVGGTVLVAKAGEVIYKTAFGMAELELGVVMQPEHVLRIGSLTKQFTAVAILKLEEEGILSIQDDISKYIEGYPTGGHKITIAHLLSHTSGIANYTDMPKLRGSIRRKDHTLEELIALFKDAPMEFPPGEHFRYNNSGYVLLGKIIELVSGTTYADYLQNTFFKPLGMNNTRYDETSPLVIGRVSGYDFKNRKYKNTDYLSMSIPYAGGALLSTTGDLLLWNNAIMQNEILDSKFIIKAHSRYKLNNGEAIDYGFGSRLGNIQNSPSIKHGGSVNGFTSFTIYLPEEEVFVAILTNCGCTSQIENIASKMAALAMDKPFKIVKIKVPQHKLISFQGEYQSEKGLLRTIRLEDGNLFYFDKGGEKTILFPVGDNRLWLDDTLVTLDFWKSSVRKIQGFVTKSLYSPINWNHTDKIVSEYKSIPSSKSRLAKYLGEYRFPNGRIFKVVMKDDKVYGQMGNNKEEIRYLGEGRFYAVSIDAQLLFASGSDGQVKELTIIQKNKKKATKVKYD